MDHDYTNPFNPDGTNQFINTLEELAEVLNSEAPRDEVKQWLNNDSGTDLEELKHGAGELLTRVISRGGVSPALSLIAIRDPESVMFPLMFALLVGYRAGQQSREKVESGS